MCKRTPKVALGSATGIAELDLSLQALTEEFGEGSASLQVRACSADLRQGFYQLRWRDGASLFGLDCQTPLGDFGLTTVYDEELRQEVPMPPDTLVYPVFEGLPMGWSWSMWLCHMITEDCMRVGISRALSIPAASVEFFREGRPVPRLRPGTAIASAYVDNANIIAADPDTAARALAGTLDEFARRKVKLS